jgi:ketosteroid isomerase-like protein
MKSQIALGLIVLALWSCNTPKPAEPVKAETPAPEPQKPIEFADDRYSNVCKAALAKLSTGDVDGFITDYADNAVYRWNSGDSLSGKPAIEKYWKDRRSNVISKINFTNDIWLPLTVTDASTQNVRKGTWVLGWFTTAATYKTGKSMTQNMHTLYHFNKDEKIDEVIQFLDRAPILAAMKK